MKTSKDISLILMLLLLYVITLNAHAGSVHKWVDAQGVTHYSDQLPKSTANTNYDSVKQIDVLDSYSTSSGNVDGQNNYYSVTNQWARMREERLERKQLQIEKATEITRQKAAQYPVEPQVVYVNQIEDDHTRNKYYPVHQYGQQYLLSHQRYKHHKKYNNYAGRRNSATCRLPNSYYSRGKTRFGSSRSSGLGLTLSIR